MKVQKVREVLFPTAFIFGASIQRMCSTYKTHSHFTFNFTVRKLACGKMQLPEWTNNSRNPHIPLHSTRAHSCSEKEQRHTLDTHSQQIDDENNH